MPHTLIVEPQAPHSLPLLAEALQEAGFEAEGVPDTTRAAACLQSDRHYPFTFFGPTCSPAAISEVLDTARQAGKKTIAVCFFHSVPDPEQLLEYSRHYNHLLLDIQDRRAIDKKLSNLKSIQRLLENKHRSAAIERSLQEESDKLVEVNVNNVRLIAEVNVKNRELELARAEIRNLLDNLDQGFMTIDHQGLIQPGFTKAVVDLFALDPQDRTLWELLRLDADHSKTQADWLQLVFENRLDFDMIKDLATRQVTVDGRYLELDYKPIRNQEGEIERLIVVATDKTVEQRYAQRAAREHAFAQLILQVMRDKNGFIDFIEESRSILGYLKQRLVDHSSSGDPAVCFRAVHTLKGNAAAYHMQAVSEQAHRLETLFKDVSRESPSPSLREELSAAVLQLEHGFEYSVDEIESAIGPFEKSILTKINLDQEEFQRFEQALHAHLPADDPLVPLFNDTFYHSILYKHLLRFGPILNGIARRLGKKISIKFISRRVKVYAEAYRSLIQTLIHPLRNAIDHGIESPEEREAAGKPATGHIEIKISEQKSDNQLQLSIRDDGRGMDPVRLRRTAVERGILSDNEATQLDDQAALRLILRPGFSTRDQANEWSGRGVGMDALAAETARMGGTITLRSRKGEYSEITLDLPLITKD